MKKVLFVLVLMMSVVVTNAQTVKTTSKHAKGPIAAVNVADLPKSITDNISKDYPGFTVKSATSIPGKDGNDYKVAIVKGSDNETLLYNKDGKFVRKYLPKTAMHHEMKKK